VIVAPDFEPDARALLQKKKNLRLMKKLSPPAREDEMDIRSVTGGVLVQSKDMRDPKELSQIESKVVTERPPSRDEMRAMAFGWKVSNT